MAACFLRWQLLPGVASFLIPLLVAYMNTKDGLSGIIVAVELGLPIIRSPIRTAAFVSADTFRGRANTSTPYPASFLDSVSCGKRDA